MEHKTEHKKYHNMDGNSHTPWALNDRQRWENICICQDLGVQMKNYIANRCPEGCYESCENKQGINN